MKYFPEKKKGDRDLDSERVSFVKRKEINLFTYAININIHVFGKGLIVISDMIIHANSLRRRSLNDYLDKKLSA